MLIDCFFWFIQTMKMLQRGIVFLDIIYQTVLSIIIIFPINGKNVYGQPINSDIKRYDQIRKVTTEQGEDFTIGCLLNFE